jgi:hypothetical protein
LSAEPETRIKRSLSALVMRTTGGALPEPGKCVMLRATPPAPPSAGALLSGRGAAAAGLLGARCLPAEPAARWHMLLDMLFEGALSSVPRFCGFLLPPWGAAAVARRPRRGWDSWSSRDRETARPGGFLAPPLGVAAECARTEEAVEPW